MLNWRLNSVYRFYYLLFVISLSFVTLPGCGPSPCWLGQMYQASLSHDAGAGTGGGRLIVACITEGDSTQLRGPTQNTVLAAACPGLISSLAKEAPSLLQNSSPSIKRGAEPAIAAADPMVAAYQGVLRIEGLYKGKIDGRLEGETADALKAFQNKHNLAVTGQADKPTLTEMQL